MSSRLQPECASLTSLFNWPLHRLLIVVSSFAQLHLSFSPVLPCRPSSLLQYIPVFLLLIPFIFRSLAIPLVVVVVILAYCAIVPPLLLVYFILYANHTKSDHHQKLQRLAPGLMIHHSSIPLRNFDVSQFLISVWKRRILRILNLNSHNFSLFSWSILLPNSIACNSL